MIFCWLSKVFRDLALVYGVPDSSRRMQSMTFSVEMWIVGHTSENINTLKW